jgi:pimeloyl-ACP methyl ester carboxylesterase
MSAPELEPAVAGEDVAVDDRAGPIALRVAGPAGAPPVVLLHSINAVASAAEVAPVHAHLAERFRVFTPDLPGFGRSDRSARDYSIRLYTDAVHDVLDAVAAETGKGPVHALALSLSSEFLARAANESPERFASLTFVTPTAFDARSVRRLGPEGASREVAWLSRLLRGTRFGEAAYRQLVRPAVIRYFLRRTFGRRDVDEGLWAYGCRSGRQPGAHHAPLAFLSGALFAADARRLFERLGAPCFLAHGTRGDFRDFTEADWCVRRPNWAVRAYPTGAIPWFEQLQPFLGDLERFLDGVDGAAH